MNILLSFDGELVKEYSIQDKNYNEKLFNNQGFL